MALLLQEGDLVLARNAPAGEKTGEKKRAARVC
jgi:hypothetical protein